MPVGVVGICVLVNEGSDPRVTPRDPGAVLHPGDRQIPCGVPDLVDYLIVALVHLSKAPSTGPRPSQSNRWIRYGSSVSTHAPSRISIVANSPISGASVTPLCINAMYRFGTALAKPVIGSPSAGIGL